ncbi:MAG: hypothetical protein CK425_06600 [Parachlamydia sp.]|nr:MAG: hypothetical protein CK425_06600 [Parachlamydia sp.]
MTQAGEHTWDLFIRYNRCPKCGYIFEDRKDFHYHAGYYEKELECLRCHHVFTEIKNVSLKLGPLIGEGEKIEMDWKE